MSNVRAKAEAALPVLKQKARELQDLAAAMFKTELQYERDDTFARMVLCFFTRQTEHMRGVIALVDCAEYRNASLMARSMIEGLMQIMWAGAEGNPRMSRHRANQWHEFSCVTSWRKMRNLKLAGELIEAGQESELEGILQAHGDQFLTRESVKPIAKKKEYWKNWMQGKPLAEVGSKVGRQAIYRKLYSRFSDWHHWSPEGFFPGVLQWTPNSLEFLAPQPEDAATVLAVAFQCLIETAVIANSYLKLGFGSQVSEIKKSYLESLAPPSSQE